MMEFKHISHINIMIRSIILRHEKAIICHLKKRMNHLQLKMFYYLFLKLLGHSASHTMLPI